MFGSRTHQILQLLAVAIIGGSVSASGQAGPGSVALTTSEPGGLERTAFPLTVGVPFARGVLPGDRPVALLDEQQRPRAIQTRVLERHQDGSVRWLLVDYQGDFAPLEKNRSTLVLNQTPANPPAGKRIQTTEQGGLLVIENGVLKLEVDRKRCAPLLRVWKDGQLVSEGGLDILIKSPAGEKFSTRNDAEARFEIEESGPLRLLMSWSGKHKSADGQGHFDFQVRLTIYAGAPFVRVEHIFFNRLDPEVTPVGEIVATFPLNLGEGLTYSAARRYRPGPGLPSVVYSARDPVRLEMYKLSHYRIVGETGGNKLAEEEDVSMGWIDASGARGGVLMSGKDFWQNYPKALSANGKQLACHLVPDQGQPFPVQRGMAKSHTFFLTFHDRADDGRKLVDLAFAVQRWPMPLASPEHYLQSGEFWDFFPYQPARYPRLEAGLKNLFTPDVQHFPVVPKRGRAYGLKNFGDFVTFSGDGPYDPDSSGAYYFNNEYDVPHMLAMMYLRSGQIVQWWGAEAHALHMMDIDTPHHPVPLDRDIKFGPGSKVLASTPRQDGPRKTTSFEGLQPLPYLLGYGHVGPTPSYIYTWAEGLVDYYHLTGDKRALETAVGYAQSLAGLTNREERYRYGMGRSAGWALLSMGTVYWIRPDPEIRKAADLMIDKMIAQLAPGKEVLSTIHPKTVEDRMITLTVRGLIRWHQATGDEKTRKLILQLMEIFLKQSIDESGLPLAGTWPEEVGETTPSQGYANLESLAYAYRLTKDRRFVDAGVGALCRAVDWINSPTDNVFFPRVLRGPFPFMAIAHELGILEKVPGAGSWLNR